MDDTAAIDIPEYDAKPKRKLTTILASDVAGYSRLMHDDEEATLTTLAAYRSVFEALVSGHGGRVFNTAGDAVLAEFESPVEAVRSAQSLQKALAYRNAQQSEGRKLWFRIGINIGDVMENDGDLFGDAVNVAARLEGLAKPGGICVSEGVHEQVRHQLDLRFETLGPQQVKNIAEPVTALRIVPGKAPRSRKAVRRRDKERKDGKRRRSPALRITVLCLAVIGAIAWLEPDPAAARKAADLIAKEGLPSHAQMCAQLGTETVRTDQRSDALSLAERVKLREFQFSKAWLKDQVTAALCG